MPNIQVLNEIQVKQSGVITTYKIGTVNGYYNTVDGKFYEDSSHVTEIEGAPNLVYADIAGNALYIYKTVTSSFVKVSGEGGGGGLVYGYLNPADDKFYEDDQYTTEISGDSDKLFITLDDNYIYRYDSTEAEFIQIGGEEDIPELKFGYLNTADGKFYEDNSYTIEIEGNPDYLFITLDTNKVYRYNSLSSTFVIVSETIEVRAGYLNTIDGKFYKESTYITELPALENTIYVDLNTNFLYRYNSSTTSYIHIGGQEIEQNIYFGYYKAADGKFYADQAYTTELPIDERFLYTDKSTEKLYRYDLGVNYYAWSDDAGTPTIIYTLSETPNAGDATYIAVGTIGTDTVTSYSSIDDEIVVDSVTYTRDTTSDASTASFHDYGYDFHYLTADDIDDLMESVAYNQWSYLADVIVDNVTSLTKVWSSSKISSEINDNLETAKTYTDEQITKFRTASYKVVSSTSEMTNAALIYLLPVTGSTYYDMYILIDGTPTQIGTTQAQLDDYYTKTESDARYLQSTTASTTYLSQSDATSTYLSKTDAASTYATQTDVGDLSNLSSDFSSSNIVGCLNETTQRESVNIDFNNDW